MSGLMLDDVKVSMQKFGVPDYLAFALMLVVCALIGVYFGFIEKKPAKKCDEESDYLVGGRQMKVIPITMSLIARYELYLNLFVKKTLNISTDCLWTPIDVTHNDFLFISTSKPDFIFESLDLDYHRWFHLFG